MIFDPRILLSRRCLSFALVFVLVWTSCAPVIAQTPQKDALLLAEARAARDGRNFQLAEQLARRGAAISSDPVWPLTLALVLADQQRSAEALAILSAPRETPLPLQQRLLAEAYAYRRGGDDFSALRTYGEVLLRDPANSEVRSTMAAILDAQRGPHGAARLDGLSLSRQADIAATLTRWGAELKDTAHPFALTDRALVIADTLLAQSAGDAAADPELRRRVRMDRLVALRDRQRMREVVAEANDLRREGLLPPFAIMAEADARLALRQPELALSLYEEVLTAIPDDLPAAYGRVFALVESERLDEAKDAADTIARSRPLFVGFGAGPATAPDPEVLYAALLAAQVRLWGNAEAAGYQLLQQLVAAAPANATLRSAMSGAHSARGFVRAAEGDALIAASLDPDGLDPQIAVASTSLIRRRYSEAKTKIGQLLQRAPNDQRVALLASEQRAVIGWQLEAEGIRTIGDGGGINRQGDGYVLMSQLASPLFASRLRLVAGVEASGATVQEGEAERIRLSSGVVLEGVDVLARAAVSVNLGALEQIGFGGGVDWAIDDHWSLAFEAERFARDTPLRAILNGIRSDSIALAARYRADERLEATLRSGWSGYTDGNDAWWASAAASQRLISMPHFDVTGRGEVAISGNSAPGGPYFAPEQDFTATLGVAAQHVSWRRYQRSFVQVLEADAGGYWQRGFNGTWIASARYEHRWRFDPWRELVYGISISRRVYDGEAERMISINAGLRQRF
ncbi:poly-beta-1,6 N-acetyl-D-glucosamine export porin PgaA [Erythrobacter sp. T5W1-R]|uniref:poly-beta-1,6 N-acetyl-D-glucosamine export porin PgaA n=1 Tax=Erythrobacter sp. T5W1-R TaxID=3101752 RepID=UPI002AFE4954|nr:poly-beta-1,6 N-acetyl-D-glucosamine export porin PgaA [Erythrobacter sp. T5W1-R]MEA1619944.1 poly-beta-1,6 N-acetyl-D-glucosamine export porin PgaA [Erythrobacter sp. T5W1-R]